VIASRISWKPKDPEMGSVSMKLKFVICLNAVLNAVIITKLRAAASV
jgi:hypothetical protein